MRPVVFPKFVLILFTVLAIVASASTARGDEPPPSRSASTTLPSVVHDGLDDSKPAAGQHVSRRIAEPIIVEHPASSAATIPRASSADPSESLSLAAHEIADLAPRSLADLVVEADKMTITTSWRDLSALERRSLGDISKRYGVQVEIETGAPLAKREREAAMAAIVQSDQAKRLGVSFVSPNLDARAVTVYFPGTLPPQRDLAALQTLVTVPLKFEPHSPLPEPQRGNRRDDDAPHYGGALMRIAITGEDWPCSTGFSVIHQGVGKLATARHCNPDGQATFYNGKWELISHGSTFARDYRIDSGLVDPIASPATAGYIYRNSYNNTSSDASPVKNWAANYKNERVCKSGATTGETCGVIIDDVYPIEGLVGSRFIRVRGETQWVSARGDSGGAWFRPLSNGVQARGIHYGGQHHVPCQSQWVDNDLASRCTTEAWYVPISIVLNTWGASLEVQ